MAIPRVFGRLVRSVRMTRCTYSHINPICRSRFIGVYSLERSHDRFPTIEPPTWTPQ